MAPLAAVKADGFCDAAAIIMYRSYTSWQWNVSIHGQALWLKAIHAQTLLENIFIAQTQLSELFQKMW